MKVEDSWFRNILDSSMVIVSYMLVLLKHAFSVVGRIVEDF